ncbi:MAG: HNH endonuclease [Bacteroidota bacterium]|nr:HNH endonuclease [Bacteroidota bacterium]
MFNWKFGQYNCVKLIKDGKRNSFYIHRLVAETYIPNPNNLPEVNHKDGNKDNNHISNLEWTNHKDNINHARENGFWHKDTYFYRINCICDNEDVFFYCGSKNSQLDIEEVESRLKEMLENESISEIECEEANWKDIDNFLVYL